VITSLVLIYKVRYLIIVIRRRGLIVVRGTIVGYKVGGTIIVGGIGGYNKALIYYLIKIFTYILSTLILLLEGFSRFNTSLILKLYKTSIRVLFIKLYLIELFKVAIILRRINSY